MLCALLYITDVRTARMCLLSWMDAAELLLGHRAQGAAIRTTLLERFAHRGTTGSCACPQHVHSYRMRTALCCVWFSASNDVGFEELLCCSVVVGTKAW